MSWLTGVRVLEVGEMVAVPYATKLLADLGADVIKIEPPHGDRARRRGPFPADHPDNPEASGLFLALNTNKRSVVADLRTEVGRNQLAALVAEADIVMHDFGAAEATQVGLDPDQLLANRPELVICALTPFGQTGPQADWVAEEITVVQGGGWGWQIPGDGTDPDLPPLTVPGWTSHCQAAMAAAFAALGAHTKSASSGIGEFIDMSILAHVSAMLEASFAAWTYAGEIASRNDGRFLTPWGIYRCADGLVFLVCVEQDQWERLVEFMGSPDWAQLDIFSDLEGRAANQDVLNLYLEEWTSQRNVEDLFHEAQARRICVAPLFTMSDLAAQQHLVERGFFHDVDHPVAGKVSHLGSPAALTPNPWSLRSPAPLLDEHAGQSFVYRAQPAPSAVAEPAQRTARPLEGVRVIDFSWVWAGPFCTMHLAHLGAEVIKIESSKRPSLGRRLAITNAAGIEPTMNTNGYFNQWDQAKLSIEVDLGEAGAIDKVLALIADGDVVVDNYATGVMDRLGLGDDVLHDANPNLIIASVTGYGHTGPLRDYMGYGPTTCPLSGLSSMTGHVDGPAVEAGLSIGDPAAGLTAAFTIVAALYNRTQAEPDQPTGARVDVALWEATAVNAVEAWMTHALGGDVAGPNGNRDRLIAPHGVFACDGDDEWVSIACTTDEQWARLAEEIGDTAGDQRFATFAERKMHETEIETIVGEWTATRDKWQITTALQALGIAAYPSLSCPEVEQNPQLIARDFFEHFDHPEVGVRANTGIPWRTRNTTNGVMHRAPLMGEHDFLLDRTVED